MVPTSLCRHRANPAQLIASPRQLARPSFCAASASPSAVLPSKAGARRRVYAWPCARRADMRAREYIAKLQASAPDKLARMPAGPAPRPRPISRHSRGVRAARSSVTTHVSVTVPASRRYSPGPPTRMHADEPSVTAKLACVSRRGSDLQYLSRPCPPRQFPWFRHGEHIAIFGMRHTCRPGLCGPPKSRPRAYSRSVIPTARSLRTESRHAIGAMCLKLLRATSLLARCRQH